MNAYQFAQAEAQHRERQLARFEGQQDADEAYSKAVKAIENELAMSHAVVLEIVAEIIFEPDFCDAVAALYVAGRHDHAGRVLTDRIKNHIEARAISEHASREAKAREEHEADLADRAELARGYA